MRPVDRFYRVRFADERVLREWSMRVLEVAAAREDLAVGAGARWVIFVPLRAPRTETVYGYVSEPARGLASGLARGVDLDGSMLSMRELPEGLTLLMGDGSDAAAYERRLVR